VRDRVSIVVKGLVLAVFGVILYETNDEFLMVGGSNSTSFLLAPSIKLQVFAFAVCTGFLLAPVNLRIRVVLSTFAIGGVVLCSHRLVIDNLHNEIRDVYMAVTMQTLAIDAAKEGGFFTESALVGFRIGQTGSSRTLWVFSPRGIGLDRSALQGVTGG
jgi:hypothetical protein